METERQYSFAKHEGVMEGVREHSKGGPVQLLYNKESGRWIIRAENEGGHNETQVDFLDLVGWLYKTGAMKALTGME